MTDDTKPPDRSRRGFLNWLLGTSIGGLLVVMGIPVGRYLIPPEASESATATVRLPFKPEEIPPNTAKIFKFGNQPGILVRTPAGELRAFSATCTHLSCTVQYREELGHIWCACHNGHFDLTGQNIAGPPPRPLEAFVVNETADQIIVSKGA